MMNENGARVPGYEDPDLDIQDDNELQEAKKKAGVSSHENIVDRAKRAAFLTHDNVLYRQFRDDEDETVRHGGNTINHPAYQILDEILGTQALTPKLTDKVYEDARELKDAD